MFTIFIISLKLLACALCTERPELEKRRGDLLHREEDLSAQLHTLQDGLLQQLAQAQGDILQNKVRTFFSLSKCWTKRRSYVKIQPVIGSSCLS